MLGFCEKVDSWELHRAYFHSKAGGFPAWLNPDSAPAVKCPFCQQSMMAVCQAYAEKAPVHAYHRVVYVFTCRNGECHKSSIADETIEIPYYVYRCQLPEINLYYDAAHAQYEHYEADKTVMEKADAKLAKDFCFNCGQIAANRCKQCKCAAYCCRGCQVQDWKTSHKAKCKTLAAKKKKQSNFIYPTRASAWCFGEHEITIEPESEVTPESETDNAEILEKLKKSNEEDLSDTEVDGAAEAQPMRSKPDKYFRKFQKRVARDPDQVLRYIVDDTTNTTGSALRISKPTEFQQSQVIPDCPLCRGKRILEFQVMPQMLYYLNPDKNPTDKKGWTSEWLNLLNQSTVDFGLLNVYTCANHCKIKNDGYAREFITRQMVSPDSIGDKGAETDSDSDEDE